MIKSYLLSEKDSNVVFAVISEIDSNNLTQGNTELVNKVGRAIEDENSLEDRVRLYRGEEGTDNPVINTDKAGVPIVYMHFTFINEIEEYETIEVELTETTIY